MSENENETEAYRQMARLIQEKAAEKVGYEYEDFSTAPVEEIVEAIKSSVIRKEDIFAALRRRNFLTPYLSHLRLARHSMWGRIRELA